MKRKAGLKVFIVAEGPSEVGDLGRDTHHQRPREGYFQPMLRKLLGVPLEFEGQKITLLGRFKPRGHGRLEGHADRAAKALALASTLEDCRVLVFVKDVDREPGKKKSPAERGRKLKEMHQQIEQGFAASQGADSPLRIKATPCRMIEAWALGDKEAVMSIAEKGGKPTVIPASPEDAWGDEHDPESNHPKCLLERALGRRVSAEDFAELAERSSVARLRRSWPDSFAPFAREAEATSVLLARET